MSILLGIYINDSPFISILNEIFNLLNNKNLIDEYELDC
jgi:hypothetical protein